MASLPVFYHPGLDVHAPLTELEEDTARHVVQVLRMQPGEQLELTDGRGIKALAVIGEVAKKRCTVRLAQWEQVPERRPFLYLAVAFTKNASRNEWLLEKATEMGVKAIIPLMAHRSEKEKFRYDRWTQIMVSAMLQSRQYHLPLLSEAAKPEAILRAYDHLPAKLIAHCMDEHPRQPLDAVLKKGTDTLVLIGPEGDFTPEEVSLAYSRGCSGIGLGNTRLRTETAAMASCAFFNLKNND